MRPGPFITKTTSVLQTLNQPTTATTAAMISLLLFVVLLTVATNLLSTIGAPAINTVVPIPPLPHIPYTIVIASLIYPYIQPCIAMETLHNPPPHLPGRRRSPKSRRRTPGSVEAQDPAHRHE